MFEDLTGKKYGRLTVLNREPNGKGQNNRWKCKCECGNITFVLANSLKSGTTQSCGCLWKEKISKHNMCRTRIYCRWDAMKQRCYNKNHKAFKDYGGRGIKICEEWLNKETGFMNFYNWSMNNGYADNLSIDRINVDGNYEPDNCRWTTIKEQERNKRNNHYIEYNNEIHTLTEWAEIINIDRKTLDARLRLLGWSIEKALTTPVKERRK